VLGPTDLTCCPDNTLAMQKADGELSIPARRAHRHRDGQFAPRLIRAEYQLNFQRFFRGHEVAAWLAPAILERFDVKRLVGRRCVRHI